ncbi:transmembrane emp24 domain-containing protein 7-like [Branchiostoma floridae]|uniref:Transmembrane emp24 domain-containing protein 7-like n=2 Tax=Branchiostoma floridae TaxID=7739 RepID=A0A9J7LA44_BRAFL|nr:transmembrane emp24 domain-containing protein 7-like [Branchiostoma floridae]
MEVFRRVRLTCCLTALGLVMLVRVDGSEHSTACTFDLENRGEICFYQEFYFPGNYSFEFQVIKGGQRDVDVAIMAPDDSLIYNKEREKSGVHNWQTTVGTYKFCFSNAFSTFNRKLIYMSLMKQETAALAARMGTKRPDDISAWLFVAKQIKESLDIIVELQNRYRRYEAVDLNNALDLSGRVHDWSLYQSVLVVVIGLGQMIILKTLFTDKQTRRFSRP